MIFLTALTILFCSTLQAMEIPYNGHLSENLIWLVHFNDVGAATFNDYVGGFPVINGNGALSATVNGKYGGGARQTGDTQYGQANGPYLGAKHELTIAFWVKPTNPFITDGQMFTQQCSGRWTIATNSSGQVYSNPRVCDEDVACLSPTNISIVSTGTLKRNNWTHIACTYSDTNDRYRIYLNGVKDVEGRLIGTGMIFAAGCDAATNVGSYIPGFSGMLPGTYDDYAIWNRELTDGEIMEVSSSRVMVKLK